LTKFSSSDVFVFVIVCVFVCGMMLHKRMPTTHIRKKRRHFAIAQSRAAGQLLLLH